MAPSLVDVARAHPDSEQQVSRPRSRTEGKGVTTGKKGGHQNPGVASESTTDCIAVVTRAPLASDPRTGRAGANQAFV